MENKLREYAKLLIEVGLNVQKGQTVVIRCPVECAFFARLCASAAYDVGCREVVMRWSDDFLERERFLRADDSVFDVFPVWQAEMLNGYADEGAAFLNISACDPEALRGVDPDRLTRASRSETAIQPYVNAVMSNGCPWCVASVPIPSWAKKVFPDLPEQEAMDKLWDAIFTSVRISGKGDAVARWHEHVALLKSRIAKLNDLHFTSLYYQNSLGTSLNIKLPETHVWAGGNNTSRAGFPFVANMPTEEVFTAPLRDGIDGVVYAALPLVHNGNIIENFHFVIKDGKIVDVHAEKGEDILRAAIAEDEKTYGRPEGEVLIIAALESARGVMNALEICESDERLFGIALSGGDYTKDLQTHITGTGIELMGARQQMIIAARAAGVQCFDTVYTDLKDMDGFRKDVENIHLMGFDGKSIINPRQIPIVHEIFTPTQKDIIFAEKVVKEIDSKKALGIGVFTVDGKMIDIAFYDGAKRTIDLAKASGVYKGDL